MDPIQSSNPPAWPPAHIALCFACNVELPRSLWSEHRRTCGKSLTQPAIPTSTTMHCPACNSQVWGPFWSEHRRTCRGSSKSSSSQSDTVTCLACNNVVELSLWPEHRRTCDKVPEFIHSSANEETHKKNVQQIVDQWMDADRVLEELKAPDHEVESMETAQLPPMKTWIHRAMVTDHLQRGKKVVVLVDS